MQKNVYEIMEEFEKVPSKDERIAVLRKNADWSLHTILKNTYDPNIKFNVERVPYYKPDAECPPGMSYSNISQALRKAYVFQPGAKGYVPLVETKKNQVLVEILESLEARESTVYMNMLMKKPLSKNLDTKIVKEAFPGLIA